MRSVLCLFVFAMMFIQWGCSRVGGISSGDQRSESNRPEGNPPLDAALPHEAFPNIQTFWNKGTSSVWISNGSSNARSISYSTDGSTGEWTVLPQSVLWLPGMKWEKTLTAQPVGSTLSPYTLLPTVLEVTNPSGKITLQRDRNHAHVKGSIPIKLDFDTDDIPFDSTGTLNFTLKVEDPSLTGDLRFRNLSYRPLLFWNVQSSYYTVTQSSDPQSGFYQLSLHNNILGDPSDDAREVQIQLQWNSSNGSSIWGSRTPQFVEIPVQFIPDGEPASCDNCQTWVYEIPAR